MTKKIYFFIALLAAPALQLQAAGCTPINFTATPNCSNNTYTLNWGYSGTCPIGVVCIFYSTNPLATCPETSGSWNLLDRASASNTTYTTATGALPPGNNYYFLLSIDGNCTTCGPVSCSTSAPFIQINPITGATLGQPTQIGFFSNIVQSCDLPYSEVAALINDAFVAARYIFPGAGDAGAGLPLIRCETGAAGVLGYSFTYNPNKTGANNLLVYIKKDFKTPVQSSASFDVSDPAKSQNNNSCSWR
jgi:hypothetical protein